MAEFRAIVTKVRDEDTLIDGHDQYSWQRTKKPPAIHGHSLMLETFGPYPREVVEALTGGPVTVVVGEDEVRRELVAACKRLMAAMECIYPEEVDRATRAATAAIARAEAAQVRGTPTAGAGEGEG